MTLSVLSFVLAIALLVGTFFWIKYSQTKGRPRKYRSAVRHPIAHQPQGVSSQTKKELRRLVHGNQDLAERLVKQVRLHNPDRSEQWCWEKAVHDLQRDRRSS